MFAALCFALAACDSAPAKPVGYGLDVPEPTAALRPDARVPEDAHVVDYAIEARLDADAHTVTGRERITWRNRSGRPTDVLPMHLYMNGFRAEDTATNRLWLRMRVEVPAEPTVVLTRMCSCEFYLNGVRIGAAGNLDVPRPTATKGFRSFVIPASTAPGPALLAVRQYHQPGVEAVTSFRIAQAIRVVESREAGEG